MKEIEKAIMNEIIFLRMNGLSDNQIKLLLEQQVLNGLVNATKLSPNSNQDYSQNMLSCSSLILYLRGFTITNWVQK